MATHKGYNHIVPLLLDAKADPNVFDFNLLTPLHMAAKSGFIEIVQALLAAKANPNLYGGIDKVTPLHLAAENGHLEIVKALLAAKADPAMKDGDGNTPFHTTSDIINLMLASLAI